MKITLIELDLWYSTATHLSTLTSISNFFLFSEVATMWQTDSTAHKLKPRSFHKVCIPPSLLCKLSPLV